MFLQDTTTDGFGDRLQASFTQVFGDIVPALLGALVILFAGYLLAKVLEKLIERFLRRIRLNRLLERGGVMQAVERSGSHINPVRVLAKLVFWLVMFAVILVAANALGLESLANVFSELVSYIPSVIAAIVIILVGIVLGGFVGGLISASAGALHGGRALARVGFTCEPDRSSACITSPRSSILFSLMRRRNRSISFSSTFASRYPANRMTSAPSSAGTMSPNTWVKLAWRRSPKLTLS